MTITNSFQFRVGNGEFKDEILNFLKQRDWEFANILVSGECESERPKEEWFNDLQSPKIQRHVTNYEVDKPFSISISFV